MLPRVACLNSLLTVMTAVLGTFAGTASPSEPGRDRQAGETLARELRAQQPAEEIQTTGMLRLRDARGKRSEIPVKFEVRFLGDSWQATYETVATNQHLPEKFVVIHSPQSTNQYAYARALEKAGGAIKPVPLGPAGLFRSFAGSDFWLADLGLEFLHWPEQRLVKSEMRKGRSCRVLESRGPAPVPEAYCRVLSWIDLETGGLLRAEAYGATNQLLKEFSVRRVKKGQLKEIQLLNVKSDTLTRLEFDLDLEGFPETE
jgi:hypothetical protein